MEKTISVDLTEDQLRKIILVFTYYADLDYQEIKNVAQRALERENNSDPDDFKRPMGVEEKK